MTRVLAMRVASTLSSAMVVAYSPRASRMKSNASSWERPYTAGVRTTPEGQPAFVPVRVTERQQTMSASLRRCRSALFGLCAIGSNAALAVAKTVVMSVRSDIVEKERERVAVAFVSVD